LWNPHFKISNQWSDPNKYKKLLYKKWKHLKSSNILDLKNISFQLIEDKYAYLGKYNYTTLQLRHYKINSNNLLHD